MAFVKGQSGNPGGRPKAVLPDGRTLSQAAREHGVKALQVLVDALADPDTAFAAAKELLDRGFGKPSQGVELTGAEGGPIQTEQVVDDANAVANSVATLVARAVASRNAGNGAASMAGGTQH